MISTMMATGHLRATSEMEPERGIEPRLLVYETSALPLSYSGMVHVEGFEPPTNSV